MCSKVVDNRTPFAVVSIAVNCRPMLCNLTFFHVLSDFSFCCHRYKLLEVQVKDKNDFHRGTIKWRIALVSEVVATLCSFVTCCAGCTLCPILCQLVTQPTASAVWQYRRSFAGCFVNILRVAFEGTVALSAAVICSLPPTLFTEGV